MQLEDNAPYTGKTWEHMPIRPYTSGGFSHGKIAGRLCTNDGYARARSAPPPHARTWYTPHHQTKDKHIQTHRAKTALPKKIEHVRRTNFSMCRTRAWAAHTKRTQTRYHRFHRRRTPRRRRRIPRAQKKGFQPTMPNANYEPNYKKRMADMQMILSGRNVVVHCKAPPQRHIQTHEKNTNAP